jgi:RNA polymerase sigma factor (sigma-70 family)
MAMGPSDEELMLAYRAGEASAFDALYARHRGGVFRYLRRQAGSAAVAEELFQDVWLRLIDARGSYEPRAKFTTWLFTIAHNRLMDHFRARARAALVSYDDDPIDEVAADTPRPDESLARDRFAAGGAARGVPPAAGRRALARGNRRGDGREPGDREEPAALRDGEAPRRASRAGTDMSAPGRPKRESLARSDKVAQ